MTDTPTPVSAEAPAPDLVERLRKAKPDEHCNDSLCAEAADTITALRAEVERLKGNMRARLADHINGTPCAEIRWQQERETLEDEVRRLRAALEEVRDSGLLRGPTVLHDKTLETVHAALTQPEGDKHE